MFPLPPFLSIVDVKKGCVEKAKATATAQKPATGKSKAATTEPEVPEVAAAAATVVDASRAAEEAATAADSTQDSSPKRTALSRSRSRREPSVEPIEPGVIVEKRKPKRKRFTVYPFEVPAHVVAMLPWVVPAKEGEAPDDAPSLNDNDGAAKAAPVTVPWLGSFNDAEQTTADVCAIRCKQSFDNIRIAHNQERHWVREVITA